MRNVALMAMAVDGNTTLDGLTADQLTVMPNFKNPMMPSLAATADAMTKVAGVLEGFAQTREFLSNMASRPPRWRAFEASCAAARRKALRRRRPRRR